MMIKYPIHKVAKDFKKGSKELPSKEVMDILTQYGHPPKNHMQPLTDQELSIVFEYLTQHNQIDSIESVYFFCSALWMRFSAAVFKPEKEKSRGAPSTLARGSWYFFSSPPWANRSMGPPPG